MWYNVCGDGMNNNKNNVISFVASPKTQEMMTEELNWCMRDKTPQYAKWQAKDGDTVITLYESGKVVFQGKDADLSSDFWITTEKINSGKVDVKNSSDKKKETKKEKNEYVNPRIYNSSSIGSDEVGTGDYFGPIVVTAAYVSKDSISFLEELGVKDSKKLTDNDILNIVPKFIKQIPYESMILSNIEYNKYYSSDINMNKIKALLHNKVLYKLSNQIKDYEYIIVDQFAESYVYFNYLKESSNVVRNITFFTKGEDKHLAVACASLISRYIFIKEFDKLSKSIDMELPKGASNLVDETGKKIVEKYGFDKLKEIAKLNFKNTEKIKEII
ncbi:MAG: ribonuclease HIII [Firmicutes bacterium]|nr:ribonuclease HIII [Bacillota bacterium]